MFSSVAVATRSSTRPVRWQSLLARATAPSRDRRGTLSVASTVPRYGGPRREGGNQNSVRALVIIRAVDLSYHPRPVASGWDRKRLLNVRFQFMFGACICWVISAWLSDGVIAAASSVVAGLALGVGARFRAGRVAIIADDREVRAIGWASDHRWPWSTLAAFDYVPNRWLCTPTSYATGTFYTGRVTLIDGTTHLIPALIGSSTGAKERDDMNLRIIGDLSAELERRRSTKAA